MITPEPSGHTTGRPDHPNLEEAKENKIKYNSMRMIETLKEEIKNSNKGIQKKNCTRELLQLTNTFSNVAGYKINKKSQLACHLQMIKKLRKKSEKHHHSK